MRKLQLELLEVRDCPAPLVFYWDNGNATGRWNDPTNWSVTPFINSYPGGNGRTDDIAVFDTAKNPNSDNVSLTNNISLGGLEIQNGWKGTMNVNSMLTVTGESWMTSPASVVVGGNNVLTLNGNFFTWTDGSFNPTGDPTNDLLVINSGENFIANMSTTNKSFVGLPIQVNVGSQMTLEQSGAFSFKGPRGTIINNGTIEVDSGGGSIIADSVSQVTVDNFGTIDVDTNAHFAWFTPLFNAGTLNIGNFATFDISATKVNLPDNSNSRQVALWNSAWNGNEGTINLTGNAVLSLNGNFYGDDFSVIDCCGDSQHLYSAQIVADGTNNNYTFTLACGSMNLGMNSSEYGTLAFNNFSVYTFGVGTDPCIITIMSSYESSYSFIWADGGNTNPPISYGSQFWVNYN